MNILAVGILGVVTFVVAVLNALSTSRMVGIMENQESEMTQQRQAMIDALERTDQMIEQNERLFNLTERPLLGVERVICEPQKDEGCQITISLINSGKV